LEIFWIFFTYCTRELNKTPKPAHAWNGMRLVAWVHGQKRLDESDSTCKIFWH